MKSKKETNFRNALLGILVIMLFFGSVFYFSSNVRKTGMADKR